MSEKQVNEAEKKKTQPKEKQTEKTKEVNVQYDPWKVLCFPHLAEKSMQMVELQNKLTFIVQIKSTKQDVKKAIETEFNVEVSKVNIEVTMKGMKKAYVTLSPKHSAADIATRLGMI